MGFVLANHITEANNEGGFLGAIIYGPQRLGKSSYAAQVLYELYGSWDKVLDHFVFDLREVVDLLDNAVKSDKRIFALCWDDAGVHANRMRYFENRQLVQYLQNLFDVVGLNVGGFLMTTPSPSNLLKALRGYEFYRVKVFRRDTSGGRRRAIGYMSSLSPSGKRIIHRKFSDFYDVHLPDEFWKPYLIKRKSYLETALKGLKSAIGP